jgi:hypothetical protein
VKIIFSDTKKVVPVVPVVRRRLPVDRKLHIENQNPIAAAPTRASAPMPPASNAPIAIATSGARSDNAPVASGASAGADSSWLGQGFINYFDSRLENLSAVRKSESNEAERNITKQWVNEPRLKERWAKMQQEVEREKQLEGDFETKLQVFDKITEAGDEWSKGLQEKRVEWPKQLEEKRKDNEMVQHADALQGSDVLFQRFAIAKANTTVQKGMHHLFQTNERGRK